ncbi:MAG: LysR family transcriptional regulator [Myxococcota bacterium]
MYDWADLRYFLAVHREGTLAAAGRELRVDPTTVGRRIGTLEEQLGAPLFMRSSRGWVTTPAGLRIVPAAQRAEEAALDVRRLAAGASERPAGRVRLATLEVLASQLIAPTLPRLRAAYPELRVDLWCSPVQLDLAKGEADLALRVGRPTEPSLIVRRVSNVVSRPYAARAWLDEKGLTEELDTLEGREVLLLLRPHRWADDLGRVRPVMRSTELSVILEACAAGLGVALLPDALATRRPELVALDRLGDPIVDPVWLAMHRDLAQVARVRAVADFLVEILTEVR